MSNRQYGIVAHLGSDVPFGKVVQLFGFNKQRF